MTAIRESVRAGLMRRLQAVTSVLVLLLAAHSPPALAAPTLTLTIAADPVESITTQLGAAGVAEGPAEFLDISVKATGGEQCGANPGADSGTKVLGKERLDAGSYNTSRNWTFREAGTYLLCGWIENTEDEVVAHTSMIVSVRAPHLLISLRAPSSVGIGHAFQLMTTAQAETERSLYEYLLPDTGDGCPANADAVQAAAGAETIYDPWRLTGGPFTESVNQSLRSAGAYLYCAYFEYPNSEAVPEATANARVLAVAPPAPCVVPSFSYRMRLSTVERRIKQAHCSVGAVRRIHSLSRRGTVLSLSPATHTKLRSGARVSLWVSLGPRRKHRR